MRKIIKIALPIIACLVITLVVTNMNGIFSSADVGNIKLYPNLPGDYDLFYYDEGESTWKTEFDEDYIQIDSGSELPVCPYAVPCYFFKGWSLTPDGEVLDDNYTLTNEDEVLYAQWLDIPDFKQEPTISNNNVAKLDMSKLVYSSVFSMVCYYELAGSDEVGIVVTGNVDGDKYYMDDNSLELYISFTNLQEGDKLFAKLTGEKNEIYINSNINDEQAQGLDTTTDWVEIEVPNMGTDIPFLKIYSDTIDNIDTYLSLRVERNDSEIPIKLLKNGCAVVEDAYDINLNTYITDKGKYQVSIMYAQNSDIENCSTAFYLYIIDECDLGAEAPKSSSKKYKAKTVTDSGEKISGSGKKNSTRTITPIEGKKVQDVIVTDKDGNKVDVTLNEDGTYSFKQPASNVDVQIVYKNREIKLEIGSTNIDVDGEVSNTGVAPLVRNDRTMFPIRFVAENLGAKVGWEEKNPNVVTISKGDVTIVVHLGSNKVEVNDKEYEIDAVAFAENNRTYLPVRFISEHLNADVIWNEQNPSDILIREK